MNRRNPSTAPANASYLCGITDLTPATIDQGAWVLATGYNIGGTAYGEVDNEVSTYLFPSAFLGRVKALVYSSPGARVYR